MQSLQKAVDKAMRARAHTRAYTEEAQALAAEQRCRVPKSPLQDSIATDHNAESPATGVRNQMIGHAGTKSEEQPVEDLEQTSERQVKFASQKRINQSQARADVVTQESPSQEAPGLETLEADVSAAGQFYPSSTKVEATAAKANPPSLDAYSALLQAGPEQSSVIKTLPVPQRATQNPLGPRRVNKGTAKHQTEPETGKVAKNSDDGDAKKTRQQSGQRRSLRGWFTPEKDNNLEPSSYPAPPTKGD